MHQFVNAVYGLCTTFMMPKGAFSIPVTLIDEDFLQDSLVLLKLRIRCVSSSHSGLGLRCKGASRG